MPLPDAEVVVLVVEPPTVLLPDSEPPCNPLITAAPNPSLTGTVEVLPSTTTTGSAEADPEMLVGME